MELVLYLSVQGLHREMPGSSPGMTNGGGYVIPSAVGCLSPKGAVLPAYS